MRVGLTGGIEGLSRSAFKDRLAAIGAEYVARLDETTDVLVVGDSPLQSKLDAARHLEVEIVSWSDFEARLSDPVAAAVPLAEVPDEELLPSLVPGEREVRILDIAIPVRAPGPLTPSLDAYADYTLDGPTLSVLRGIARAVVLGHPCLIEGDTATSKTSAVRFLAALCGAEVVRLNLNGQTDTGELVGRYVPAEAGGWRFAEGLVPQAMRNGWWVVLDEVNLSEPAVLERLNPCLERVPELVLTEGPGTRFGPGGDVAVHPEFRVIATMNPAEYAGRSVLSEAWRDRFVGQVVARPAGELELRQLLEHAVHGEQPVVEVDGRRWGPAALPGEGRPKLAAVTGLEKSWPRIASLFAGLIEMSTPSAERAAPLGVRRRERYVFSRRGVLGLLDAVDGLRLLDPGTGRMVGVEDAPLAVLAEAVRSVSVERMRDDEDRDRVATLVASLGLQG
ncbi:MAG: AAA family ATPase [Alphaproteobacteria bacterium]|nr:AAA family ATPase [Alphaproteobacteria bacterium]